MRSDEVSEWLSLLDEARREDGMERYEERCRMIRTETECGKSRGGHDGRVEVALGKSPSRANSHVSQVQCRGPFYSGSAIDGTRVPDRHGRVSGCVLWGH